MQIDVQEYWNNVDRAKRSNETLIVDNFAKRQVLVQALLSYPLHKAKVIELGTGLGVTADAIKRVYGKIYYCGLDISEKYADTARKVFKHDVRIVDLTEPLPVPDNICNTIFAFDTLEHIQPDKREGLWKELDRILHKQERLIFILNPLDESHHNSQYDFHLDERDIAQLAHITNTRIVELKILMAEDNKFQFIVLGQI